jgi:hypothetical protein
MKHFERLMEAERDVYEKAIAVVEANGELEEAEAHKQLEEAEARRQNVVKSLPPKMQQEVAEIEKEIHGDGVGGVVLPAESVEGMIALGAKYHLIDGVPYLMLEVQEGHSMPIVLTAQGWTVGGMNAIHQHQKNVAALSAVNATERLQ